MEQKVPLGEKNKATQWKQLYHADIYTTTSPQIDWFITVKHRIDFDTIF